MNDNHILELYNKGHSIDYITKLFYLAKNREDRQNYYKNGAYIVTKKTISKDEARMYVIQTIIKARKKEG